VAHDVLPAQWSDLHPEILPEEWLLFDLAKIDPSDADLKHAITLAGASGFSWTNAWNLATRLWVHGLVSKNVRECAELSALVPRELKPILALSQFTAKTRYAIYAEATAPAFAELASSGVPVVLLNGAALVSRYPPGTRLLNDLDLLIRRGDNAKVSATLQASGFQRVLSKEVRALGKGEDSQLRTDNETSFVKHSQSTPLSLDVHWSLHNVLLPFTIDNHSLLSRAVPVRFGAASLLALSPEDTLLNYASQLIAEDLTVSFVRLADIHAVVSGGISWKTLCDTAIRAQAAGAIHLALKGACLLGAEVPDEVFRTLEDACHGCGLGSEIVAEPRWPLDRFKLAGSARNVLTPLFSSSTQYRRARIKALPREAFRYGKRMGRTTWQCYGTSLRALGLTLVSAVAVGGLSFSRSPSSRSLTRPLRSLLWRRRR